MSVQTIYRHSFTSPVRGKEVDVNLDRLAFQFNLGSKFSMSASATVANTTDETTLIGAGSGSITIPANTLLIGMVIRVSVAGVYSAIAVPGTLQFRVRMGGIGGTVVLDSGAQTPTANAANRLFEISGMIQVRTIGGSGTVFSQGKAIVASAAGTAVIWDMETTAAVTIDTTVANDLQVSADWQTADPGNTITATNAFFEILGG